MNMKMKIGMEMGVQRKKKNPHDFFIIIFMMYACLSRVSGEAIGIGINYGQLGSDLPAPEKVLPLLRSLNITNVKLYDYNPAILSALTSSTGVSLTISIPNDHLRLVKTPSSAQSWLDANLRPFLPTTCITSIALGNEVLSSDDPALLSDLLPAMTSLRSALPPSYKNITITTPHSLSVLLSSFPPSSASFLPRLTPHLSPLLSFLSATRSPFLINAYPFLAYKSDHSHIPLPFVLFQQQHQQQHNSSSSSSSSVLDPNTNLLYDNMLFAQLDAVHSALDKLGHGALDVQVSETGWPSKGDEDEVGASAENARRYNGNLMRLEKARGTPLRPGCPLVVYVFALFNENMKPGPTSERNYGLFRPDGSPVYDLGFRPSDSSIASSPSPSSQNPPPGSTYTGFLNVSGGSVRSWGGHGVVFFCWVVVVVVF